MLEEKKNNQLKNKKINFWTLYEKFKSKVISHFLITTVLILVSNFLLSIIDSFFNPNVTIENDYSSLLPWKIWDNISKNQFILGGLLLVFSYSFLCYFVNLWEEELRIKGKFYVKNLLLDKFRQLTFRGKQAKKGEIGTLIKIDSEEIGYSWEHLPNHVYHSILAIILIIWTKFKSFQRMSKNEIIFSAFWLVLINLTNYFFNRLILIDERKYKKSLSEELAIINKEKEKSFLIESMGLHSQYEVKQKDASRKSENLALSSSYIKSLGKIIPNKLLTEMFPYLLLIISQSFLNTRVNLLAMWWILDNFREIFKCFWDYWDYVSSLDRINDFLSLPEKNDNLTALKLNKKIKAITFQNVFFKYNKGADWVLSNYNHSFVPQTINNLEGKNGMGKSTIFYLILGVIKPIQGKIIIETEGKDYDLEKDINLENWRKEVVAYFSHENLMDEESGSTGEKQLLSIEQTLLIKKNKAQVYLFDEAGNALDKKKEEDFDKKLAELKSNLSDSILIYTKH